MSLHISYPDFEKMVDKECSKRTGLNLPDFPTIFCEDYWPVDLEAEITVHDAKISLENCMEAIISTMNLSG